MGSKALKDQKEKTPTMKIPFTKNIRHRLERLPMLKALVPFAAGILLADCYTLPAWGVAIGFVVCAVAAYLGRGRWWGEMYIVVALLTAGGFAFEIRQSHIPREGQTKMEIIIRDITSHRNQSVMGQGRIVAYEGDEGVNRTTAAIRFVADTALRLQVGERVVTSAPLRDFDREQSYGRYMMRKGFAGELYLRKENIIERQIEGAGIGRWLRTMAAERIERLALSEDTERVAMAISTGDKSGITGSLRENYTRSGAAHLLAVSGLHVGFLCVVVSLLLGWMLLLRRGHLWRSAVVAVAIWLYAAMVGFTPSVIRAATMFTVMQAAINLSSRTSALNTLCFTAFMMLCWDARMIYDGGFLLSAISVAAIIEWGVPLSGQGPRLGNRLSGQIAGWAIRWLRSAVVVAAVAAVATMPLAAYLFGVVSLWSVVVGPAMVALCAMAVGVLILWILMPIAPLQGAFAWVAERLIGGMNAIAEWCARSGVLAAEWEIGLAECVAIYTLFAIITLTAWALEKKY